MNRRNFLRSTVLLAIAPCLPAQRSVYDGWSAKLKHMPLSPEAHAAYVRWYRKWLAAHTAQLDFINPKLVVRGW